jgi:ribose transport system ATP-binding protein
MNDFHLLHTNALSKFYPGVKALDSVDFDLAAGEVHVLFGENGAGKSTLISLLSGANTPSAGSIHVRGVAKHFDNVHDARAEGISAVFQEFSLIPTLTVAQNLCLGEEPLRHGLLDHNALVQRAQSSLNALHFDVDASALAATLSRAQQQMVEIAKGLRGQVSVLILDEPTASLTKHETANLFALIGRIKEQGVGIVYISHRMQEISQIADRVTVLRDGRKVCTVKSAETSHDQLIALMSGRQIKNIYPTIASNPGEVVLDIQNLSTHSGVNNASITVRRGEVVGLAGLVGCGKSELLRAAYGLDKVTQGQVRLKGKDHTHCSCANSLERGYFYLPPDRKHEGLVLGFSSASNITLSALKSLRKRWCGWLRKTDINAMAKRASEQVELASRNISKAVGLLSGGNQQKVLFAKGLTRDMDLYVFDEPTVGVDVGTRAALYEVIKQLCEAGAAVVVISSDLPEVLHLSHRAYVMCRGEITGELCSSDITESGLLKLFFASKETEHE